MPDRFPFAPTDPLISIFALGGTVGADISRKLWVEFDIRLAVDAPVTVGGILFGGYPFVPYVVNEVGENVANFGLPREIQLAWRNEGSMEFLDADTAVVRQQPTSHCHFHVLRTKPIHTDRLILKVSGFPRLMRKLTTNGSSVELTERWAVAIPYLYVFTYQEGVRYRPHVPAGLLAAI